VLDDREGRVRALVGQHPALEKVCNFISLSTSTRDIHQLSAHHAEAAAPSLTRAYVTAYRDEDALETALKLRHELNPAIPLVVALSRAQGVSHIISDVKNSNHFLLAHVDVFPTLERTCTVDLIRGGSFETIAHALHEHWRVGQLAAEKPAPSWAELDESRKESSRAQARAIAAKLRSIGCEIAPLCDWDASDFTFASDEIEALGTDEHERWNRERIADGWTLVEMPKADDPKQAKHMLEEAKRRKETPYLLAWGKLLDLYPDVAELDRDFVREYPAILASVGLQIIRVRKN
jgi:hypothetical protein